VYYLNSTGAYVLASSVLKLQNGSLEVDVPLPSTNWLETLRNNQEWLIDVSASATHTMGLRHVRYVMSARCMSVNEFVNSDGFNPSAQSYNGTELTQCPVFLVQGMPWSTVQAVLRPGFVWQVRAVLCCAAITTIASSSTRSSAIVTACYCWCCCW
jgi:hypothetical protein